MPFTSEKRFCTMLENKIYGGNTDFFFFYSYMINKYKWEKHDNMAGAEKWSRFNK